MPTAGAVPLLRRRVGDDGPLRIGMLVSATGANLSTLIDLQHREPGRFRVALVASHGTRSPALALAREHGIEAWPGDFDARCGTASAATTSDARAAYRQRARLWHDGLDARMAAWERDNGALDLVVLAYHRWIEGNLLTRHHGRMINQHPGDLTVLDREHRRVLIGNDPVAAAMRLGHPTTRTSCFLVDGTHDGGAILCQGPAVPVRPGVDARAQELDQKRLSDRPCLEWTVRAFAAGSLALAAGTHPDGSRVVLADGTPLPLGGMRLTTTPVLDTTPVREGS
ncbi:methionyl-tRNA formyltransferase [Streptomyces sp. A1136]|uniref:methionyl-tRNA formyltransferase n=1 Tax=Streptomyces sp. A1136 TaxID=2563102 RepID=UPI00109EBF8F|nr:methionyl-tRNA formyltransferase [Streptomyces sp. A1136]THA51689.1 methionyl-tRNA formyltransferase [Streptomyces sp. A1136]